MAGRRKPAIFYHPTENAARFVFEPCNVQGKDRFCKKTYPDKVVISVAEQRDRLQQKCEAYKQEVKMLRDQLLQLKKQKQNLVQEVKNQKQNLEQQVINTMNELNEERAKRLKWEEECQEMKYVVDEIRATLDRDYGLCVLIDDGDSDGGEDQDENGAAAPETQIIEIDSDDDGM